MHHRMSYVYFYNSSIEVWYKPLWQRALLWACGSEPICRDSLETKWWLQSVC